MSISILQINRRFTPSTWLAFVTLAAAILGVVLAFRFWGALT